jgi:arginine exporter protein ArgO
VTEALVAGLLAGYGVAIPVGAIAALLVSLTAHTSLRVGASAALGVATADGLYAVAAVLGGTALARVVEPVSGPLRWVAAGVLVVIAASTARSALRRRGEPATARRVDGGGSMDTGMDTGMDTPPGAYLVLLGLTLLNPATIVYYAALVLGRQSSDGLSAGEQLVFVVAAFAASASWQLLLAGGGSLLGRILTGPRGRLATALASSAVISVLAISLVLPL